jgi:hypothetical protein
MQGLKENAGDRWAVGQKGREGARMVLGSPRTEWPVGYPRVIGERNELGQGE